MISRRVRETKLSHSCACRKPRVPLRLVSPFGHVRYEWVYLYSHDDHDDNVGIYSAGKHARLRKSLYLPTSRSPLSGHGMLCPNRANRHMVHHRVLWVILAVTTPGRLLSSDEPRNIRAQRRFPKILLCAVTRPSAISEPTKNEKEIRL